MSEFEELRDKLAEAFSAEMNAMTERGPVLMGEAKERLCAAASTVIAKHYADQIVVEQDRQEPNKLNILFPAELAERFGLLSDEQREAIDGGMQYAIETYIRGRRRGEDGMIPTAKLLIEFHPTNPPRPISCAVVVDGKPVAFVTLDDLRAAAKSLADMTGAGPAQPAQAPK